MDRDDELFIKRAKELAYQADNKGYTTLTDFLNLNEINLFLNNLKDLPHVHHKLWGGYEEAERKRLAFTVADDIALDEFNICVIQISPLNAKFADSLTHRDFLGALLNLGIERAKLGDILIKENIGYVFADQMIATYITDSLCRIKHTNVSCLITSIQKIDIAPSFKEIKGSVSSVRLDAILALALKTSRSSITELIAGGKVFVNSRLIMQNSATLRENDIISVRGHGKFIYCGITNQTKKGRLYATILRYI